MQKRNAHTLKPFNLDKPQFNQKNGSMGFQPLPSAAATSPAPGKSRFVEAARILGAAQLLPRTAQYLCVGEKYMADT